MPKLKTAKTTLKRASAKGSKSSKSNRRGTAAAAELTARQAVARRMFNPAAVAAARKAFQTRQRADHAG